ncbi:hypothetical protein AX17_005265 [Amanita inopinata Kibby_2008]|nr:hypothetical protein AX17_005265 [Amanita inopinata Kibby_2008]
MIQGPSDVEWRYEMRRECQEILPNLYLGPFVASKSLETLQALGVTHIVCIRDAKEAFSVRPRFENHFKYLVLDVQDNEEQNLIRLFPGAKTFIDTAIAQGGRVLVHCNDKGMEKLCKETKTTEPEGFGKIAHNLNLTNTFIKEYEAIYKANLAVASYPMTRRSVVRRKRGDDDDDDDIIREDDRKRVLVQSELDSFNDPDAMET